MKLFKLVAISAAVLGSSVAMANTTTDNFKNSGKTLFNTVTHPAAVSAEIGTLGAGANVSWGLNDSVELQAGWTGAYLDDDIDLDANDSWINYEKALGDGYGDFKGTLDYDIDASNPYLGVQMRPMKNWLTVGAGVIVPNNSFDFKLTSNSDDAKVSINGHEYKVKKDTTIDLEVENKNILAPYATIGFRPNINSKWGMFAEAGAAYTGGLEADVKVTKGTVTGGGSNEAFEEAAKKEIEDVSSWYPIAKVGLTYRF